MTAALKRLCDTATTRTGIQVSFHEVGQAPQLATPVEVALLRIAQGALGNVVQHAKAGRADVTLTGMDTAVTLDVVDNGTGSTPKRRSPRLRGWPVRAASGCAPCAPGPLTSVAS